MEKNQSIDYFDPTVLSGLWVLHSLSRTQSLGETAKALNVTPSAIIQRIQRLEKLAGHRLRENTRTRARLTPFATQLLNRCGHLIQGVELAWHHATAPSLQTHTITILCTYSLAKQWLIPYLTEPAIVTPACAIKVIPVNELITDEMLGSMNADLLIRYLPINGQNLCGDLQFLDYICPVVSPASLETWMDPFNQKLTAMYFLHDYASWGERKVLASAKGEWEIWRDAFGHLTKLNLGSIEFNTSKLAYKAAICGQGVAMGRGLEIVELIENKSLTFFGMSSPLQSVQYQLVLNPARRGNHLVMECFEWLEDLLAMRRRRAQQIDVG